jgi:UDP-N-acetylmuramate: L-alanyl-gamma-D-glutamyl-meso-diaminopimelate ligase
MHIHILGICGTFMGGLAALAREAGHKVTGCDAGVYPPMSDQLRALGIDLIEGFSADQMSLKPDVWVVGNVVSRARLPDGTPKFPLMEAILESGEPYTSGPQWLSENVLAGRHVLAVAGTHGKTTTTSMLAWILECAGLQPGFLVGGVPMNFGISARLGGSACAASTGQGTGVSAGSAPCPPPALRAPPLLAQNPQPPQHPVSPDASPSCDVATEQNPQRLQRPLFVIEADEYDTAFFDKRSKFVHYRPRTAILNNLEFDHADIFDDLAAIERQFHHLVRTVPGSGRLVVNAQEASLQRVLGKGCWSEVVRFGEGGDACAIGDPQDFEVDWKGQTVTVQWALTGLHNQMNALAAIAAAGHVGVSPQLAAQSLARFENVKRRMEVRGKVGGITVYDDFAHHPTAIRLTVNGLRRTLLKGERIIAVFEPRSNTMKLGTMKSQLPWSLEEADLAICHTGGLDWNAAEALSSMGARAQVAATVDEAVAQVLAVARRGDHVLCMSNGGFGGIHARLLNAVALADSKLR